MKDAGYAHMGVGRASGKDKAEAAANMAISSPLLETAINGAKGVIINITSSPDIGLEEIETASSMITKQAHEDANIIWGAAFDETMEDEMSVTVIATGFSTHDGSPAPEESKKDVSSRSSAGTASAYSARASLPRRRLTAIPWWMTATLWTSCPSSTRNNLLRLHPAIAVGERKGAQALLSVPCSFARFFRKQGILTQEGFPMVANL